MINIRHPPGRDWRRTKRTQIAIRGLSINRTDGIFAYCISCRKDTMFDALGVYGWFPLRHQWETWEWRENDKQHVMELQNFWSPHFNNFWTQQSHFCWGTMERVPSQAPASLEIRVLHCRVLGFCLPYQCHHHHYGGGPPNPRTSTLHLENLHTSQLIPQILMKQRTAMHPNSQRKKTQKEPRSQLKQF